MFPVLVKDFDKPAHMGALEMLGQIDVEIDRGGGVLALVVAVKDVDRILQTLDADLLKRDFAVIPLILDVNHDGRPKLAGRQAGCFP